MGCAIVLVVPLMYLTVWEPRLQLDVRIIKFVLYPGCALLQLLNFLPLPFVRRRSLFEDHRICLVLLGVQNISSSAVKVSAVSARETLNGAAPRCPLDISEKVDSYVRQVFCRQFQPVAVVLGCSSASFRPLICVLTRSF